MKSIGGRPQVSEDGNSFFWLGLAKLSIRWSVYLEMPSATDVSQRSARSVKKLYGALIRLGRKWPVSATRKDRSLWEAIPRVSRQRFELLKNGLSGNQIKTYGEAGVKELEALRRMQDNTHLKKVRSPLRLPIAPQRTI